MRQAVLALVLGFMIFSCSIKAANTVVPRLHNTSQATLPAAKGSYVALPIVLQPKTNDAIVSSAIQKAVTIWNSKLNYQVFTFSGPGQTVFVKFFSSTDHKQYSDAAGLFKGCETDTTAEIDLDQQTAQGDLLVSDLLHEMGHAIGLNHSMSESSIMYPILIGVGEPDELDVANALTCVDALLNSDDNTKTAYCGR